MYVAFLSTTNYFVTEDHIAIVGGTWYDNPYMNGQFVYHNASQFSQLMSSSWDTTRTDADLKFVATFGTYEGSQPPMADAGPDQTVAEAALVTLDGSNSGDADGTIVSYEWIQTMGAPVVLSSMTVAKPTFTAPPVGPGGTTLAFQLTATDNTGMTGTATAVVNVTNVNQAPVADAGPDQTVPEGTTVTLDGSNSRDLDGAIANCTWAQTAGPNVTLSDSEAQKPTFMAPVVGTSGAALTFKLTVTDDLGLQGTATVIANVSNVSVAPAAKAGDNQTVAEGATVTLDASASTDADGAIVSTQWKQIGGAAVTLSDAAARTSTFTAPAVGPGGAALTFELTVKDGDGLKATDTVVVNVTNVNQPPVGNAGPDQSAEEGALVSLDGSSCTDPDGDETIVSYAWKQTAGPAVTLSNPADEHPTFTAPTLGPEDATLEFEMTVTDNGGLKGTDKVVVRVAPKSAANGGGSSTGGGGGGGGGCFVTSVAGGNTIPGLSLVAFGLVVLASACLGIAIVRRRQ
jgi:hypothetical protein